MSDTGLSRNKRSAGFIPAKAAEEQHKEATISRLEQVITEAGISIRSVSRGAGVGISTLWHLMKLKKEPRLSTAWRIADFVGRPIEDTFPEYDPAITSILNSSP